MKRSTDRILTTHTGSLPRPDEIVEIMRRVESGEPYDKAKAAEIIAKETRAVVHRQAEMGLDVISDGEQSKTYFSSHDRLGGFESIPADTNTKSRFPDQFSNMLQVPPRGPFIDLLDFPEFAREGAFGYEITSIFVCTKPIKYVGHDAVRADIKNLKDALQGLQVEEAFLPASSAPMISRNKLNEYYASEEDYLFAIADALNEEYREVVNAGFLIQIDAPELPLDYFSDDMTYQNPPLSETQSKQLLELRIEAINRSLKGIDADKVRLHVCWGNYEGPHHLDTPLATIVEAVLKARVGAIYIEASNPRHVHEWELWKSVKLPDDMVLIPGVIDSVSNFIEHPAAVAQRIENFAGVVGRERVIAASDCGFGTLYSLRSVHPTIAWAKLQSIVDGARLASEHLWK